MSSHWTGKVRHEVKMTCDEIHLLEVRTWLRLHPEAFSQAYPPRQVNNVYLDTYNMQAIQDNLTGLNKRCKTRFRWYGVDDAAVQGFLELKHKSNQIGWKESCSIPCTFDLTAISWGEWLQELRDHASGSVAVRLTHTDQPVLLNRYQREYYETPDGQMRVTLDYDQRAYSQIAHPMPNLSFQVVQEKMAIVELKFAPDLYQRASDALCRFPIRTERHSKYVSGWTSSLYV